MIKKVILLYVGVFFTVSLNAQNYTPPPPITYETIEYELPELIINDSIFINGLDSLIFNSEYRIDYNHYKYAHIYDLEDENTFIIVELRDVCGGGGSDYKGLGFFEHNGLVFIVKDKKHSCLFTVTNKKRKFAYEAHMWGDVDMTEDDLPIWVLRYVDNKLTIVTNPY